MFTKTFKQISYKNVDIAGGKGASLGEMFQAGIPIPPGFVVLAPAFDKFLKETDLDVEVEKELDKINFENVKSVDQASKVIRLLIDKARFPEDIAKEVQDQHKKLGAEYVAVRSSATAEDSSIASWAGELESYLNVKEDNLLKSVKKCWSSLFTPRAIFYRFEKGLIKSKVSVAVVIQEMVNSEIAGITFTVHPVTKDPNQIIIEAGFGLGEAIVSGSITPDSYVIEKDTWNIIDINVAEQAKQLIRVPAGGNVWKDLPADKKEKQKLTGEQIIELAKLCFDIEKHYKFPCDIEWAFEGGKFYITQSRPITTL
ncbi:MAG TPA: PEP/pyruvate-binding domain-containing protein [Candidatus Bipolaricaulota bacterium]|nr:PEP/pyruvate-binding domain-containing protein [Candidatus Bipolaricaulota bacterium]